MGGPPPRIWILFLSVLATPFILLILLFVAMVGAVSINNFKAHQALDELKKVPIPPDSRVVDERGIVGRYLGDTGNWTDIVAYRVFLSDLPEGDIRRFYSNRPDIFATSWNVDEPFEELSKLGDKTCVVPVEMAGSKVPDSEKEKAYVLVSAHRMGEAILDIRGY